MGGEEVSGRVDILLKRIAEKLVSKTGNLAVIGAYAQIQPLTDALVDHYLGGLTLEDLAVEGAERVVNRAKRVRKKVAGRVRKAKREKREVKRKVKKGSTRKMGRSAA